MNMIAKPQRHDWHAQRGNGRLRSLGPIVRCSKCRKHKGPAPSYCVGPRHGHGIMPVQPRRVFVVPTFSTAPALDNPVAVRILPIPTEEDRKEQRKARNRAKAVRQMDRWIAPPRKHTNEPRRMARGSRIMANVRPNHSEPKPQPAWKPRGLMLRLDRYGRPLNTAQEEARRHRQQARHQIT